MQLKPSLCKFNNGRLNSYFTASFKARNLHPIEFYGSDLQTHSTPQPSKYVSQTERSCEEKPPWETCKSKATEETLPLVGCYRGSHRVCRLTSAADRRGVQVLTVSDSPLVLITPIISDWSKVPHFKMGLCWIRLAGFPTKWNVSQGFEYTVGEVKGHWRDGVGGGRPGEPCLQGSLQSRGSRMSSRASSRSIHQTHKSPLATPLYVCMSVCYILWIGQHIFFVLGLWCSLMYN